MAGWRGRVNEPGERSRLGEPPRNNAHRARRPDLPEWIGDRDVVRPFGAKLECHRTTVLGAILIFFL